jgi:polysaccharide deacetylase 2 family uncharacterized protein YibQ
MTDELNRPLGQEPPSRGSLRQRLGGIALGIIGVTLAAGAYAAFLFIPRDPYGGEPHAVARIEPAKPLEALAPLASQTQPLSNDHSERLAAHGEHVANAGEIEQMSGVKVTRTGSSNAPGAMIIQLDRPVGIRLTPAPDKRLIEKGRYGPLPRIGADGSKPMEIYARPVSVPLKLKAGVPRIAIVVGGLGLNPSISKNAIDKLPEAVSLGFAPYGQNLEALAASARDSGHEILLQTPMEPFDYRQNNPGPHTLLTSAPSESQLDDLEWLMSRFTGYAGVMNFLGARFTSDEVALTRVLAEVATRGLFFLDDATSPRSLVVTTASRLALPAARVDVVIDAKETTASIDQALTQLELLARDKGVAVGFANALPATVTRIARFARDLERRGIALVPVTATLTRTPILETRTAPRHR